MNPLSLERINRQSYYEVKSEMGGFSFVTEAGIQYIVHFTEEFSLGGCQTYQFMFSKLTKEHSSFDHNVKSTLVTIVKEFFEENHDVLLYICDTSDSREASRDRLFRHWFRQFAETSEYAFYSANAQVEGEGFFAAIIVEKNNPKIDDIKNDFEKSAKGLAK